MLPGQHGAWAIILACFIIGSMAGDGVNLPALLTLVAVIASYFAYHITGIEMPMILRIIALTTIVPAVAYASSGRIGIYAMAAWFACLIFFCSSLFRVRHLKSIHELSMRQIGYREMAYTTVFAAVAVLILKLTK